MAYNVFQIKHFETITATMLNWMNGAQSRVTDFNVGSVIRTLFEAVAMALEEIYYYLHRAMEAAIPAAIYDAFSFQKLGGTFATGSATFSRPVADLTDHTIPSGTSIATAGGVRFQTTETVTLSAGSTSVSAAIQAEMAGSAGNVAAGIVTVLQSSVPGIYAVTNSTPTLGGADLEDDSERKNRFQAYIQSLARATQDGLIYGAMTATLTDADGNVLERVTGASTTHIATAYVNVYIDNGTASGPSTALIAQVQNILDGYRDASGARIAGYRAAGVQVDVTPATITAVPVAADLKLLYGRDPSAVVAAAADAVAKFFAALGLGDPVSYEKLIVALANSHAGIDEVTLTSPGADISILTSERAISGTVTLTTS